MCEMLRLKSDVFRKDSYFIFVHSSILTFGTAKKLMVYFSYRNIFQTDILATHFGKLETYKKWILGIENNTYAVKVCV